MVGAVSFINSKFYALSNLDLQPFFKSLDRPSDTWLFMVLLLQVGLFAWTRLNYQGRYSLMLNAFVSNRFTSQLIREERSNSGLFNLIVEIQYLLASSLFLYSCILYFNWFDVESGNFLLFISLVLVVVLVAQLKSLFARLMVWFFSLEEAFKEVYFYRFLGHGIVSLVLFPLIVMSWYLEFSPAIWLYFGITVLFLVHGYRLFRSALRFWGENSFSLKYIILYICALEILPLALLVKYLYNEL